MMNQKTKMPRGLIGLALALLILSFDRLKDTNKIYNV